MRLLMGLGVLVLLTSTALSQDRLPTMPRYDRYTKLVRDIAGSVVSGGLSVTWSEDSKSFTYRHEGKGYKYDVEKRATEESEDVAKSDASNRRGRGGGQPDRGRQFSSVPSPDGKLIAVSRDRNVFITNRDSKSETTVTTDGSVATRIKFGVASWVYGEELGVRNAMWWSPDGLMLAYYRFDESAVKDYYVTLNEAEVQNTLDTEAYPKAGAPNPKVELYIYNVASQKSVLVDTKFASADLAEYIYDVQWSEDGKQLFFNRTNRHQNVVQMCSADPNLGACHVIVEEKQLQSWAENHPEVKFLKGGDRFLFASETSGFKNYYLYNLSGKLLNQVTHNQVDAMAIVSVDEDKKLLYYSTYGSDNPYFRQLHRCGLDGKNDQTLTSKDLDHDCRISPDGRWIVDVAQSPDHPSETRLLDSHGKIVTTVMNSDLTKFDALGLKKTEIFRCVAADGKTPLYGTIQFPSDFDPTRKYPVILSVYGGPESGGTSTRFATPAPVTELGFLVVNIAGRGTMGRGKAFRDAVYKNLGEVEIDDQNAGIRSLESRSYVDLTRVGVFGTSYGGYATCMLLLRHPETFAVGCASSSVTDWHNYDSIYTERYMSLPDSGDNQAGYEKSSAMKYAKDLRGKLMLYFGSADNNVHNSNTYQLTRALENAGKSYDMTVGADKGHTGMNSAHMWEYFVTHLILQPHPDPLKLVWNRRLRQRAKAVRKAGLERTSI